LTSALLAVWMVLFPTADPFATTFGAPASSSVPSEDDETKSEELMKRVEERIRFVLLQHRAVVPKFLPVALQAISSPSLTVAHPARPLDLGRSPPIRCYCFRHPFF
jgi:hypothetical protein